MEMWFGTETDHKHYSGEEAMVKETGKRQARRHSSVHGKQTLIASGLESEGDQIS